MATTLRKRDGRTYAAVLDDDGEPLVTTCASCGGFDYVAEIGANGFEYCPDCATPLQEPEELGCRVCMAALTPAGPGGGYVDSSGSRVCLPVIDADGRRRFQWHRPPAGQDDPGQWITARESHGNAT